MDNPNKFSYAQVMSQYLAAHETSQDQASPIKFVDIYQTIRRLDEEQLKEFKKIDREALAGMYHSDNTPENFQKTWDDLIKLFIKTKLFITKSVETISASPFDLYLHKLPLLFDQEIESRMKLLCDGLTQPNDSPEVYRRNYGYTCFLMEFIKIFLERITLHLEERQEIVDEIQLEDRVYPYEGAWPEIVNN